MDQPLKIARDKKVFWFDTETTGTDPSRHGIIQLAGIITVNGAAVDEINLTMNILPGVEIDPGALKVHGYTEGDIRGFRNPYMAYLILHDRLSKYCSKQDDKDRYYLGGFNVGFDIDFIASWFNGLGKNEVFKWFSFKRLDPLPLLHMLDYQYEIDLPDYKLSTVAEYFNIELKAHDAFSDIKATIEIYDKVRKMIYPAF